MKIRYKEIVVIIRNLLIAMLLYISFAMLVSMFA
jgi:hypothetical protein